MRHELGIFFLGAIFGAAIMIVAEITRPKDPAQWTEDQISKAYQRGCTISTDPNTLRRSITRCPGDPINQVTR